ncbi:MAG: M48 family metalloprotease [Planctomycetales bacterium]|nr:M48 family metalloprotease [Planctomycetales bacterium]
MPDTGDAFCLYCREPLDELLAPAQHHRVPDQSQSPPQLAQPEAASEPVALFFPKSRSIVAGGPATAEAPDVTDEEILALVQGSMAPVKTPIGYRVGILLAMLVMLSLPLIYLGLIGLVGSWIYHDPSFLSFIVGSILILFMIKPLFRWQGHSSTQTLASRDREPLLFEFVESVCRAVRAPAPRRIEVDCDINASAGFRLGYLSLVWGNDLVLTIGAPLLTGMRIDQFAGVLAHEFGHFSQGAGMRLTYVIRRISHWFVRVVYERDQIDQGLWSLAGSLPIRIGFIFWVSIVLIWLIRKVLWLLMMLGNLVSGFMLRQMEYDADSRAVSLVGGATVESTHYRLAELSVGYKIAMSDLAEFYQEGRLCDNLAELVAENAARLSEREREEIKQQVVERQAGIFDTHPSTSDRIKAAHEQATQGVMQSSVPAVRLLQGSDSELLKQATLAFYRQQLGEVNAADLHDTESLLARQKQEYECFEALDRVFGKTAGRLPVPVAMQRLKSPPSAAQARERWLHIRSESRELQAELEKDGGAIPDLEGRLHTNAVDRICCTLQHLFAHNVEHHEHRRRECESLVCVLEKIEGQRQVWGALASANAGLEGAIRFCMANEVDEADVRSLYQQVETVSGYIRRIIDAFKNLPYPFEHAKAEISVTDALLSNIGETNDPVSMFNSANAVHSLLGRMNARIVGRLSAIAEELEAELQWADEGEEV